MKNIKTIFSKLFVAALAGAFLAGCTNTFDVNEGATGDAAQPAGYVKVLLANIDARTIFPNDWTDSTKGALTYYLSGTGTLSDTASSTKTLSATKLEFDKITGSGQEIELSPGTWTLTLNAYQLATAETEPAASNMVLTATNADINLTKSGSTESFSLKPVSATSATGTVSISGTVNCGSYLKKIVQNVGTYSSGTFTAAASGAYAVTTDVSTQTASGSSLSFSYSKDVVAASNYYYIIDFYNAQNESLGHYQESLIVNGGNVSSKTLNLGDYLNSPATNPSTLAVETSFTNTGLAANGDVPTTFLAKFTWDDKSGNETGFELKIYKGTVSDGTTTYPTAATYTIKKGAVTIGTGAGNVKANSNLAGNADPTMGKDETTASVYLETGYTYKASIRAYNRFDVGDESDTPTNVTSVNSVTGTDCVYGMFTVAYTLGDDNAFVKTGSGEDDKAENEKYVVGYNYKTAAQDLMAYVAKGASSASYPYVTITSDTMKFKKWITTVASMTSDQMDAADAVTNIAANNITNLTLTGVWKSVASVTVVFPSFSSLASSVWLKSYKIGDAAAEDISSNDTLHITADVGKTIVFTYDDTKVSDVAAVVDGASASVDSSAHTVTFATDSLSDAEGHWYLTISGTGSVSEASGQITSAQVSQMIDIKLK